MKNYPLVTTLVTTIVTGMSTFAFNKLRKRKEEVVVTGTEHDTVKRISHSSIETIERLNKSFEELSEKLISQRKEFSQKFGDLSIKLEESNKKNLILTTRNSELQVRINSLEGTINSQLSKDTSNDTK